MDKMLRRSLVLVILFVGCILTGGVEAAILEVGPSGYLYTSIQAAINDAADGDTVLVHDGTYVENINFLGKAITVKSVNGAASTIINGNGTGSAVTFSSGEGSGSVLDGFTITNGGTNASLGGGIGCYSSSPIITNCIITGNRAYHGGGIDCESNSSPTIINCTISGNTGYVGGGIFCKSGSSPTITNCKISGNTGTAHSGAIGCDSGGNPIISNCILSGNTAGAGGGIYSYLSSPIITNCTISGNTATNNGGGIYCEPTSSASVKNTILWGDVPNEIYLAAGSSITVTYSDVDQDGYEGSNGNVRQDPLFVDPADGDFSLQLTSPCIDAGTSDGAPPTDMKGNSRFDPPQIPNTGGGTYPYYDMGALEYVDSGWDLLDPPAVSSEWYLYGVHFTSATEGWAVGQDGNTSRGVLLHYSGGTWTSVTPPALDSDWDLEAVHFTSASNGWAVGGGHNGVVLLHYSRGTWTSVIPPSGSSNWYLYGVQFTSANEGWAVGIDAANSKGVLLHYSKKTWTSVTPPTVSSSWFLKRVHFTSATEGWAVGMDAANNSGVLLHYLGGTWTSVTSPSIGAIWGLRGVHFTSATEGWAVGYVNLQGMLLHYSGGTWTQVTPPSVSSHWNLWDVHFTSATEGWAIGFDEINNRGVLLHYSGGTWSSVAPPSVSSTWALEGVRFTSPNEGWAVGYDFSGKGTLLHYSFWPEAFSSKLSIKGFARDSNPADGECHVYAGGIFYLSEDDHGTPRYYTGTYSIASGKSILFTLDSDGISSMKAMLTDRVTKMGADAGVTIQNISFVFDSVSISKGTIQKKTNAPSKLTIKITGTVEGSFDGVDKAMSFTYQSSIKYYSP